MEIYDLRASNVWEPVGFNLSPLSLSWKYCGAKQRDSLKSVSVCIYKNGEKVYDSNDDVLKKNADKKNNKLKSNELIPDSKCFMPEIELSPMTRYTWKVSAKTLLGDLAMAESFFETGHGDTPWKAKWICMKPESDDDRTEPVFVKEFDVKSADDISFARIYMCALGLYEIYINGRNAMDEYLALGFHSYDMHLQTQTIDIGDFLVSGTNKIEVYVGEGWFKGRIGYGGFSNVYGDSYYLIQEIHLRYTNSKETVIGSDESYKCFKSPVLKSGIYEGETFDARHMKHTKELAVKLEEPRCCGKLCDRYSLPVKIKDVLPVKELIRTKTDELVLDFGQNVTGWPQFYIDIPKGRKITLKASEILQDGKFYNKNLRGAKAAFTYVSDGKRALVRPHFTFYGFRYMLVEGLDEINTADFCALHLRSDIDETGRILTGKKSADKLFENAMWSQKDNSLDVPTDCPQRDERLGWTGDAQIFSDTACMNMDMAAFYRKYLWDMRAEQHLLHGSVPHVVPRIKKSTIGDHGSAAWGDAGVIIPWNLYLQYGSKALLQEAYPGMKAWVDYLLSQEETKGGPHLIKGGFHFGDWLALDRKDDEPFGATDPLFIASIYYMYCSELVAKTAGILYGEDSIDAIRYMELSGQIHKAVLKKYYDADGLCTIPTQTAHAMTIMFDVSSGHEKEAGDALERLIISNRRHLSTGFVGTPLLCPALTKTGHHDLAVELFLGKKYPGWMYEVEMGATTIWERWDSVMPDGHMNPNGMNSLNHYAYGSIEGWMYHYVCGLMCDENGAGYKNFTIEPHPDRRLFHAIMRLESASGKIESGWEYKRDGRIFYTVTVPIGSTAKVVLPEGKKYHMLVVNAEKSGSSDAADQKSLEETGNEFIISCGRYSFEEVQ